VVNATVTKLVSVVTVLPPASWTVTTGWAANTTKLVAVVLGWEVNTSLLAVMAVLTVTLLLDVLVAVQLRYTAVTMYWNAPFGTAESAHGLVIRVVRVVPHAKAVVVSLLIRVT
jgi:hypothetical protein